jgi:transcriptional regulator with XRE-family HTH domain
MAQITIELCRELARARREKGMTQSALAEAVGCKQSAISMLEAGQAGKLSRESVEKAARLLGVELPKDSGEAGPSAGPSPAAQGRGYCPNALCPSNVPYLVDGRLLFWPRRQPEPAGPRCAWCGEVLETHCPECGAAASDGACCTACGKPRVTDTVPAGTDKAAWAGKRRAEIEGQIRIMN